MVTVTVAAEGHWHSASDPEPELLVLPEVPVGRVSAVDCLLRVTVRVPVAVAVLVEVPSSREEPEFPELASPSLPTGDALSVDSEPGLVMVTVTSWVRVERIMVVMVDRADSGPTVIVRVVSLVIFEVVTASFVAVG